MKCSIFHTCLLSFCLFCVLGASSSARAETASAKLNRQKASHTLIAPASLSIVGSLAGTRLAMATGGGGQLMGRYQLWRHFGLSFGARFGLFHADLRAQAPRDSLHVSLHFGVELTTGASLSGWEGLLGVRYGHVHTATLRSWAATPFANIAGDSSGGVEHRNGFEAYLGVVAPQIVRVSTRWGLVWGAELTTAFLPSSDLMAWSVSVQLSIGLRRLRPIKG